MHDIESSLLKKEAKLKNVDESSTPNVERAFYSRGGRALASKRRRQAPSRIICDYCGMRGHTKKFCREALM